MYPIRFLDSTANRLGGYRAFGFASQVSAIASQDVSEIAQQSGEGKRHPPKIRDPLDIQNPQPKSPKSVTSIQ